MCKHFRILLFDFNSPTSRSRLCKVPNQVQHELDTAFGFWFCPSTTSGFLVFDGCNGPGVPQCQQSSLNLLQWQPESVRCRKQKSNQKKILCGSRTGRNLNQIACESQTPEIIFKGLGSTSGFESVSSNRCFMSLAIVKKTSSTFMFVLALCIHGQINQSKSWTNDFQQLSDQCLLSDQADFTQTYLGRYMRASLKSWHAPYSQLEASGHNCNQIQITLKVPQIITGHSVWHGCSRNRHLTRCKSWQVLILS